MSIAPSYDELHDRVTEDARLLELMELLRECRGFLEEPEKTHEEIKRTWATGKRVCVRWCPACIQDNRRADLVKRIEEVLR